MKERFVILWSTGSGRAKACARRLHRLIDGMVETSSEGPYKMDDYFHMTNGTMISNDNEKIVWVCCISTTGDGEQNMECIQYTWNFLKKKSTPSFPSNKIQLALFCLGDRAYGPQFCAAGRKFATRLLQLQVTLYCPIGYGDDGTPPHGIYTDFDDWFTTHLQPKLPTPPSTTTNTPNTQSILPPTKITFLPQQQQQQTPITEEHVGWKRYTQYLSTSMIPNSIVYQQDACIATVIENKRLTPNDWFQETRHVSFSLSPSQNYNSGDVAYLVPFNSKDIVNQFINVLPKQIQDNVDTEMIIGGGGGDTNKWPSKATLRGILTYCADIQGIPEREDLFVLSTLATDKEQQNALLEMSEVSSNLYGLYVVEEKRLWHEILYDFHSIQNYSMEQLLSFLPIIRPRQYSIASYSSTRIELCVAIVQGKTPLGRTYMGQCSRMLSTLTSEIPIWIRPGSFPSIQVKKEEKVPLLLIGAGTGIAPLRSIIQQFSTTTNITLIFGCRHPKADYYYQDEWKTTNTLTVHTAFSRMDDDQKTKKKKEYVQYIVSKSINITDFILNQKGRIFVAGGAKMVQAVKEEIISTLSTTITNPKTLMLKLQKSGHYRQEAWN